MNIDEVISAVAAIEDVGATIEAAIEQNLGGIGHEWDQVVSVIMGLCECRGGNCYCLDVEARLQQLLAKAQQQQPSLDDLVKLEVHLVLLSVLQDSTADIPACQHAVAARLAVAEAYYRLIALPVYRRRAHAAAAAAAATGSGDAIDDDIEWQLYRSKGLICTASFTKGLLTQWNKVLRRLQKAAEALPPDTQPLSPANASKLSLWICEGAKGVDTRLEGLLPTSHTLILWAAAVCRVTSKKVFSLQLAVDLVQPAAVLAAALLDVTCTMGRLSAAGISFNTQPSPAAVAAALDLAAHVLAALAPYQHDLTSFLKTHAHQFAQQLGEQPPEPLLVPPLYLPPLQQQQHDQQRKNQPPNDPSADFIPGPAQALMQDYALLWSLGGPVICCYGAQLLQQWEQQLQWQEQQRCATPPAADAAAAAAGEPSGGCSSGSSRPAWEEAEGMLLLGTAALEGPAASPATQQQQQQQLALCRPYQQQFQQAAANLGLSSDLMAAVAASSTAAAQYSSSSSGGSGSSEGVAAGTDAVADCLHSICAAALMVELVHTLVDPNHREAKRSWLTLWQLSAAEELAVADFCLQAPGLLTAAAVAALQMQAQHGAAAAAAGASPSPVGTGAAVLPQLPMVAYLLQQYHTTWRSLSRLLCGELTAEEQQVMQRTCTVWKQHQQHQQQLQQLQGSAKKSADAVRAAAGLLLLSNSSILLQQLLRMAAAAGSNRPQRQEQEQLTAAVMFCADASGGVLSLLGVDLTAAGAGQPAVGGSLSLFSKRCCCVLARAVQAFEAAVRHCVRQAGSTRPASSSTSSTRHVVPPSIGQVEVSIVGMYPVLIGHGYGSSSGLRGLSCPQQQLLQAVLSMLLTSAKLWPKGLQPPVCLELMWSIALAASRSMPAERQPTACHPGAPAAAAPAAAAAAGIGVVGGVQVCHLVTRVLSYMEQQLRKWVAGRNAAAAANCLAAGPPPQLASKLREAGSVGALSKAGLAPEGAIRPGVDPCTQLDVIVRLVQASYNIVRPAAGLDDLRLVVARHRVEVLYPSTQTLVDQVVDAALAGLKGGAGSLSTWIPDESAQQKMAGLLAQLRQLADALRGFGSVLAASLPSRFGCNWPGCVRLSGASEGYGLVRGQACVCGGCRQARYCSAACQAAHWPDHKAFCQQQQKQQQQAAAAVMPGDVLMQGQC